MNSTSDSYHSHGDFRFPKRNAMNAKSRRDNCFQFINRNNYRYAGFRGGSKVWTRSQTTKMPLAAANPPKPFTPKPPVNLIITIPNFSGVCPPDLFTFQNSSAKSVKYAPSAPARVFPRSFSCAPANKDVGANLKKSDENDVQYLYTVERKGAEFVEVVDLSEDSEVSADRLRSSNSITSDVKKCGNGRKTPETHKKETFPSSDAAGRTSRKRKKSSEDLHCDICESGFQFIKNKGEEIFKARCGHMFCQQCLKQLDPYKCPECNLYLQKLFKVFL